jgi:hypothetical protein
VSARASRKLLAALTTDEDQPPSDHRAEHFEKLLTVNADVMSTIREVFAGTTLPDDQAMVGAVVETHNEVVHSWANAKRSFIEIGRSLNRLDSMLRTKAERTALKAGFEKLFPLSEAIASQFRKVAEAIDSGRIAEEACPASYSAAYQLALLEAHELEAARGKGLIGPGTSRSALIAFRKQMAVGVATVDVPSLMAEHRRIDARMRRMQEELRSLAERKAEIERLLQPERAE